MRGIAKIALQRGEHQLAKAQYERILGKALIGRGQPAEHWAHAEYAWLQFQDKDLMVSSAAQPFVGAFGNGRHLLGSSRCELLLMSYAVMP